MDRKLAAQALSWCDQLERALQDNDQETVHTLRGKLVFHFAKAEEQDIRVAIECVRARAQQVLNEPKEL